MVQDIKRERPVKPYLKHVIGRLCGLAQVKGLADCLKHFDLGLSRSLMSELEKVQSLLPKLVNVLSHLIPILAAFYNWTSAE